MTPKIVTEENVPAQVFVGRNIPYPIQSISNDLGNVITNNFDYRDVGTLLRVTPLIGDNDVITMQIEQELTNVITATSVLPGTNQVVVGPTTNKTKTTTKVHVPDGFFIIISGQILQETIKNRTQVPCLGSIPIIGAAFSSLGNQDNKNNLLIFIRPSIIETEDQIQNLTRHQQSIWDHSHHTKNPWKWEAEEAYDFLNLKPLIDTHAEWTWE
jgi:type III secretion protein C